jgi:hypothetical protein
MAQQAAEKDSQACDRLNASKTGWSSGMMEKWINES